jgi:hypothetical protein
MQPVGVGVGEARSSMFSGFRNYVLARTDVSVATLYNAQSGLFRATVAHGGSPAQAAELDPGIRSFGLKGTFALTEPDHGSDIAGGLATTARRDGEEWILDGTKRWIGAAANVDVLAVFARDVADGAVKAFLVPGAARGVSIEPIGGKMSLRPMQNAVVRLDTVRLPATARLERIDGWRDVARILRVMRSDVAWIATGLQAGALEAAIRYTTHREQFGRTLGGFQLIQEKLARMLGKTSPPRSDSSCSCRPPRTAASTPTRTRRWPSSTPRAWRARRQPSAARCSAATASSSSTTLPGSSPTRRPSTPTKEPTRSTPSSSGEPSPARPHSPDPSPRAGRKRES